MANLFVVTNGPLSMSWTTLGQALDCLSDTVLKTYAAKQDIACWHIEMLAPQLTLEEAARDAIKSWDSAARSGSLTQAMEAIREALRGQRSVEPSQDSMRQELKAANWHFCLCRACSDSGRGWISNKIGVNGSFGLVEAYAQLKQNEATK